MPSKATVSDIISRALDFCDIPATSGWVDQTRLVDMANDGLSDMHYRMVLSHEDYLTELYETDVQAGEASIPLPSDFFKLSAIFLIESGTRFKLDRFNWRDHDGSSINVVVSRPRYRVIGQHIRLFPPSMGNYRLEIWYIRQFRELSLTEEIDQSLPHGWDCYVVGHIAEYLLQRKEADPTPAAKYKAEAWDMILASMPERDASGPKTAIDTSYRYRPRRVLPVPYK